MKSFRLTFALLFYLRFQDKPFWFFKMLPDTLAFQTFLRQFSKQTYQKI